MKRSFLGAKLRASLLTLMLIVWASSEARADFLHPTNRDRDLVNLGPRSSFYQISSDSSRWWRWGLSGAPVAEPEPQTHGTGSDAIVIPFDQHGHVTFAPVYIYTITPDRYQEALLAHLVQGISTTQDVQRLFGSLKRRVNLRGYEVWYYEIPVHNTFQEYPGSFRD